MTDDLDLNLLPLYRVGRKEWSTFPGLSTISPPRKSARGRQNDQLIIYLTLSGNASFSKSDYAQMSSQIGQHFYHAPGSLTTALRSTVERLNRTLVEQNMRTTGSGQYIVARLILGVLRETKLVLTQSGPTHVFHIKRDHTRHVHDPQISGRGLGLSQTTPLHLSQLDLERDDLLVLCTYLHQGWEQVLLSSTGFPSIENLRRKMSTVGGEDLNAILVQLQDGTGKINILRNISHQPALTHTASGDMHTPDQGQKPIIDGSLPGTAENYSQRPDSPSQNTQRMDVHPPSDAVNVTIPKQRALPTQPNTGSNPLSRREQILAGQYDQRQVEKRMGEGESQSSGAGNFHEKNQIPAADIQPKINEISRPDSNRKRSFFRFLDRILKGGLATSQKILANVNKIASQLLPNFNTSRNTLSNSMMAFTAIAVPLLVVTVASIVYMRYGKVAQYEEYYQVAIQQAINVVGEDDPAKTRLAWEQTLYYLDKAEYYQVTQQSQALRAEAQNALDGMDSIVRLNFVPGIQGGLRNTVEIIRMLASSSGLFMLDGNSGSVIYARLGDRMYEEDPAFRCGPGTYSSGQVGKLIDILMPPLQNPHNAALIGIDTTGTLIYCPSPTSGQEPEIFQLNAPDIGFKEIHSFTIDEEGLNLYILDPPRNAIWVYSIYDGEFSRPPTLFFGPEVPDKMSTSIDMDVKGEDLYLLFKDGSLATCTLDLAGEAGSTRCSDLMIDDTRPGHQPGLNLSDAIFSHMTFTAPPDPSLYLLEPLTQAVFRFTPRLPDGLVLQGQFRASTDKSDEWQGKPATAMVISPNRYLFISIGSQVFVATDVP